MPKIGVPIHLRPMGPSVIADLDTLLVALYVELTDRIIPARRPLRRASPGRPPTLTDAELVCLAVAQVLLRYHDEHHWLRAAPSRVGHLFPRLQQLEGSCRIVGEMNARPDRDRPGVRRPAPLGDRRDVRDLADQRRRLLGGRIVDDLPVALPRPRDEDVRASAEAVGLTKRILSHLGVQTTHAAPSRLAAQG